MFYLGTHTRQTCTPQSWHRLWGVKCVSMYVCACVCVWEGGCRCGRQQGFKLKRKKEKRPLILYILQYSFCITHSVGSVTKARLRCSCDEPSSDAVMCLSLSLLTHSGYLVVSLSVLLACSPPCLHIIAGGVEGGWGRGWGVGFSST